MPFGIAPSLFAFIVVAAFVDAVLKAIALWKSARRDQMAWFVCLLVFNTAGILPGVYLLFYSKSRSRPA